ncbi:GAF domain-containing sensor histidine kinase [Bacillus sp. A116_S68]|nr:GAF domain-containing sensor histidine kinase [Bacillus sp. A116_S68]
MRMTDKNEREQVKKLNTLKVIAEKLNEANELDIMLKEVLHELLSLIGMETGWIFLVNNSGHYTLAADVKLPPALTVQDKKPMCEGDCWCIERFNNGRLKRAVNIIECKRLENAIEYHWGETNEITHHATIPLRAGVENFGLLNVTSPKKTHFSSEELALLEAVAFQIGTAIKRIKLTETEQKMALMNERNRLARDLHDSVNQLLFSLKLTAGGAKEMTDDEKMKDMLSYMINLSQEAASEMRALIWQLRPQWLEEGVTMALMNYGKVLGIEVAINVDGVLDLSPEIEEVLWRIGQEALNNIQKHANTKHSTLNIIAKNNSVCMDIIDQGNGFDFSKMKGTGSLGLASMKERTDMIGGTFNLETAVGKGTKISVSLPI